MEESFWKQGDRVVLRIGWGGSLAGTVLEVKAGKGQSRHSIGNILSGRLKAVHGHEVVKVRWDNGLDKIYPGSDLEREVI